MRDSIWFRTLRSDDSLVLERSDALPDSADVVIIGSGLIGLAAAFYLVEAGVRDVCVIDRGSILGEASGANAGGLWPSHEALSLGPLAPLAQKSLALYQGLAERFDFDRTRRGSLELVENAADLDKARRRTSDLITAGCAAELLSETQLREAEPALAEGRSGAIFLPDDGQANPAKLAAAWVRRIREAGGRVCSGVDALRPGATIETSRGAVAAGRTVVAAGAWTPLVTAALGWKPPIRPVRGALLALASQPSRVLRHTVLGERFYWWQLEAGYVAGGGSEEQVGFERRQDEAILGAIRADLERLFPALADQPTLCSWYGFRPHCADMAPAIGPVPGAQRVWVSAGHFRRGVLLAPISGKIIADLIVDGVSADALPELSPDRFGSAVRAEVG